MPPALQLFSYNITRVTLIAMATALSFTLIGFFRDMIKKIGHDHFENKCFSGIITLHRMIMARYDAILNQSERVHLYNLLSNYTN